jgi:hypothetical protein
MKSSAGIGTGGLIGTLYDLKTTLNLALGVFFGREKSFLPLIWRAPLPWVQTGATARELLCLQLAAFKRSNAIRGDAPRGLPRKTPSASAPWCL